MTKDIFTEIYGEEETQRNQALNEGLNKIQEKYIDWFKTQPSKIKDRAHAEANEYIRVIQHNNRIQVIVFDTLPQNIQDEIKALAVSIYK